MITPFFSVDQDEIYVYIDIKISHVRFSAKAIEMVVDDDLFIFSLSPYYLRLRLPGSCVDDERSNAEYDASSERIKVKIAKKIKGQVFHDLDLTSKLLARQEPQMKPEQKPLIEELDVKMDVGGINSHENNKDNAALSEGERFNWEIPQEMEASPLETVRYGFNDSYNEVIGVSMANGNDINELGDPEQTSANDRVIQRLIKENIKFDPEYYASDYIMQHQPPEDEDDVYKRLLEWKSPTSRKFLKWYKDHGDGSVPVEFSRKEQEQMLELPKKTYLVDASHVLQLMVVLVTLLFGYHFDMRETEGEHNIESAWTIGKIVPVFSCLDTQLVAQKVEQSLLKVAVITMMRRSLSYPLHRNFDLSMKVWGDVYYNLRGGKRLVLQSLLDLKELFRYHDIYYVYDKIWLQDMCSWMVNEVSEEMIRALAHDLKKEYSLVTKSELTFEKTSKEEADSDDEDEEDDTSDDYDLVPISIEEIEQFAKDQIN